MATQQQQQPVTEYLYKILVVGDIGTGKIGVDFALKVLKWDNNIVIRLQLWDIAGQERFGNMTRVYYKEAVGALVVFDITRPPTFDAVQKWKSDIEHKVFLPDERPIPCVLLANKCDLANAINKSPEEMNGYCAENGFVGWFETSAKDNRNIEEAVKFLVEKILENHVEMNQTQNPDTLNLSDGGNKTTTTSNANAGCSC